MLGQNRNSTPSFGIVLGRYDARPVFGIDVDQRLVSGVVRGDELAGLAIDVPENRQLAHRERRGSAVDVHEHAFEHFIHVVRFAGDVLEVPGHLSRLGIERERAVRVERVAGGAALKLRPRFRLGGAPVHEVCGWIVAAGHPRIAARSKHQRLVVPGVPAGFSRPGDSGCAPQLLAGLRVVAEDVARVVLELLATGQRRDDDALYGERSRCVGVALLRVHHLCVPHHVPRPRVQRDEARVAGRDVNPLAVDRDVARRRRPNAAVAFLRCRRAELPQKIAVGGVDGLRAAAGRRQKHDAVVHERRRLMLSGGHAPRPRERQLADVLFVDLCERAVARTVVGAPPVNPLARLRLLEHRVGDGPKHAVADAEIPHLALHLRSEAVRP